MARHPLLQDREIPFVILNNKCDLNTDEKVNEIQLRQALQIDRLRTINPDLQFFVKDIVGKDAAGVSDCLQFFEERIDA